MAKNNRADYEVIMSLESKEYKSAMREVRREEQEFKKNSRSVWRSATSGTLDYTAALKKMVPAIGAGTVAIKAINTAVTENQTLTDEMARITASAKASWESFADALINADLSIFFSNMDNVVNRAREAADALDALGTTRIFADKGYAEAQSVVARSKNIIYSPNYSPEEKQQAGQALVEARTKMRSIAEDIAAREMETMAALLAQRVTTKGFPATAEDFIEKGADGRYQVKPGSSFEKYYADNETYARMNELYQAERKLRFDGTYGQLSNIGRISVNAYIAQAQPTVSEKEFEEMRAFLELSDEKLQEIFGHYSSALREIERLDMAEREDVESINKIKAAIAGAGGTGVGGKPTAVEGSIAYFETLMAGASKAYTEAATAAERLKIQQEIELYQTMIEDIRNEQRTPYDSVLSGVSTPTNFTPLTYKEGVIPPIPWGENNEGAERFGENLLSINDALIGIGSSVGLANSEFDKFLRLLSSSIKLAESLDGLFGSGSKGEGSFFSKLLGGVGGVVGFIGSLFGFAGGGIVGGTSYRGDNLAIRVNSGEMVLNQQEQRNLFDAIQSGNIGGGVSDVKLRGEDIYISLRAYMSRSGKVL